MISIVIPNYNGKDIIGCCLNSIIEQNYKNYEIIVIDNASSDYSSEVIKQYPVIYIQNNENFGFAKAVNQGIEMAKHKYVFLMNSDVILHSDTLEMLLCHIEQDDNIFSVQPKMLQYYQPNLIDDAGDVYTPFGWAFPIGKGLDIKYYSKNREIFSSCAGAALYRKSKFAEIGMLDERFFAYMEDVDIGYRAMRRGYKNIFIAGAAVNHIGSASFGKNKSPLKVYLSGKNNYLTIRNNMPLWLVCVLSPFLITGFVVKGLFFSKLGFGDDYKKGIAEGHRIWSEAQNKTVSTIYDIKVLFFMLIGTIEMLEWKLRLRKQK